MTICAEIHGTSEKTSLVFAPFFLWGVVAKIWENKCGQVWRPQEERVRNILGGGGEDFWG